MNQQNTTPLVAAPLSNPVGTLPDASAHQASQVPSSRFQDELDNVLHNARDEETLRRQVLECILRHRTLVGIAWFAVTQCGTRKLAARLEHPAVRQEPLRDWIVQQCRAAANSQRDVIAHSSVVRNLALIALPITLPDDRFQAIALLLANPDSKSIDNETLAGRAVVRAVTQWYGKSELRTIHDQLRATSALLELAGRLESTRNVNEASRVLADSVRDYLNCDLAAVGVRKPGRVTTRLAAVSGLADFDRNSDRARRVKAALDEAVVRDEFTAWPAIDDEAEHQILTHRKLAEACHSAAVMSMPLRTNCGVTVGAITVTGGAALNRPEVNRFLQTMDVAAGNALDAVRRAQQGWLRRAARCALSQDRWSRVAACLLLLAAITAVMFIPFSYRVACRFRCEPVERRFCVAPHDGLVQQTFVEPGDVVHANQLVARMDDREIRFELSGLTAEQHRAGKRRDVHLADEQIAESFMAALEVDRIRSRGKVLDERLETLEIRSQAAGVVLTGSFDRRENYPVKKGQLLYEIAPLDPLRLELAVPAEEVYHVQRGMQVEFRLDSDAGSIHSGTIHRVRPRSEIVDGDNVFVAEVDCANPDGMLRPGMEGSARIVSRKHPLGWNLFHRAYEYTVTTLLW